MSRRHRGPNQSRCSGPEVKQCFAVGEWTRRETTAAHPHLRAKPVKSLHSTLTSDQGGSSSGEEPLRWKHQQGETAVHSTSQDLHFLQQDH